MLQGSGCAHVVVKVLQRGCKLAQQLFLAGCVWVASGESSAWAKCLLQQGRRVVDHFFVQAVCRPGLETFAAVSCLQFVVGKTSFVPRNVNQYNPLLTNKLLIIDFGTEKKKKTTKDFERTPLLPPFWSAILLPQATLSPFSEARGGL